MKQFVGSLAIVAMGVFVGWGIPEIVRKWYPKTVQSEGLYKNNYEPHPFKTIHTIYDERLGEQVSPPIEIELTEVHDHQRAIMLWVSDPVKQLFVLNKVNQVFNILPDMFLMEDKKAPKLKFSESGYCEKQGLMEPRRGIAKLLLLSGWTANGAINAVGCAGPVYQVAGRIYGSKPVYAYRYQRGMVIGPVSGEVWVLVHPSEVSNDGGWWYREGVK